MGGGGGGGGGESQVTLFQRDLSHYPVCLSHTSTDVRRCCALDLIRNTIETCFCSELQFA